METIINTMGKRTADSNSRKQIQQLFFKSFLIGAIGYFVFLLSLATTYWFISTQFSFGKTKVDSADLIISLIGFFILFVTYFIRDSKPNNIYK